MKKPSRFVVRPWYLTRPRLWGEDLRILDQRSFVSRQWQYVFMRVPKAANSSVLTALLQRFPEQGLDPGQIEVAKRRAQHFHRLGFAEARSVAGYFTFTMVRNPYTRLLSAYLDKFRAGDKHLDRFGARVARHGDGEVSFPAFCRYLAAGGEAENAHWMRQTRIVSLVDRLDFVGRMETLDADLATVAARIGGEDAGVGAAPHSGPPSTGADRRLRDYYDAECRQIVSHVYAGDFVRFGYAPDAI